MNYKKMSNVLMFMSEDYLKENYTCYGHFYCNDMGTERKYPCRSVLEIISNKAVAKPKKSHEILSGMTPNAVVIMMNPGSSVPLEFKPCNQYDKSNIKKMKMDLVLTDPDPTQSQIMRVMCYQEWDYVRVINLSDLRNPASQKFIKMKKQINSDQHSIFSDTRSKELKKKLIRKEDAPIICAWGVDKGLSDLTDIASLAIPEIAEARKGNKGSVIGYAKDLSKLQFHHAYSTKKKKEWLEKVLEQLNDPK